MFDDHAMKMKLVTLGIGLLTLNTAGCSADSSSTEPTGAGAKKYEEILAYDWTIEPGVETYYCIYETLKEELWVSDFRPISPTGTHHVTLGYSEPGPPDGVVASTDKSANPPCTGITLGQNLALGATKGTDEFTMPSGVAAVIPAGKQLLLSVHVLNSTASSLSGHTGVEVVRADPAKVEHEAEIIFAAPVNLNIPPGRSTQTGDCTLDADSTVFAVLGHMHTRGVHLTSTAIPASGPERTLLDYDYKFDEQKFIPLDPPLVLAPGDKIRTACTYENPGPHTLTFGESTELNEMCITISYRYPRVATSFLCVQ
jgi:hypothetical protein